MAILLLISAHNNRFKMLLPQFVLASDKPKKVVSLHSVGWPFKQVFHRESIRERQFPRVSISDIGYQLSFFYFLSNMSRTESNTLTSVVVT